jgi:hypothetical protein
MKEIGEEVVTDHLHGVRFMPVRCSKCCRSVIGVQVTHIARDARPFYEDPTEDSQRVISGPIGEAIWFAVQRAADRLGRVSTRLPYTGSAEG